MKLYRGITRQEAERAGIALERKPFSCSWCGVHYDHTASRKHWETECTKRPGSTVKPPSR